MSIKEELKEKSDRIASRIGSLSIASQTDVAEMIRAEKNLAIEIASVLNYLLNVKK